jgi:hypothetical protein
MTHMGSILRNASQIAGRQHGVITATQLIALGLHRSAIGKWLKKGLLHREFDGVYRLGHRAPSVHAHYMAAVLACGPGAALSGLAAAYLYGLTRRSPSLPEVSAPSDRDIRGIITRRRKVASRVWQGIPMTTVEQTIQDLAGRLSLDDLARVCHEAEIKFRVTNVPSKGVKGAAKLRAIYNGDHALLLSEMEREFKRLLEAHDLPLPRFNRKLGAHYIDARYDDPPLTIELQSFRHHSSRAAWESDFERQRAARRHGDAFLPYTWKDIYEQPGEMLDELTALLGRFG